MFGDQISLVAIPLLAVVSLDATAAQMGLVTAAGGVPLLAFGLITGVWVDRIRRRPLLVVSDVARAIALGLVPLAWAAGFLSVPLLVGVVFACASFAVVFHISAAAFLPVLLPYNKLIDANARLTQTRAVAQIAGPGLGGALVQAITAPVAILLDAASFLSSALLVGRITQNEPRSGADPHRARTVRAIADGMSFVWQNPLLRASAASAGTYTFFSTAILALQVLYLSRNLELSPAEIGILLGAAGPGGLIGAALAVRASTRWGLGR
ncbi:MAG: MFS transporter, partial [Actinopolymorphaceae bacterium]